MDSLVTLLRACMHACRVDVRTKFSTVYKYSSTTHAWQSMANDWPSMPCMHATTTTAIAIYGQLGQLCVDPEYYNQHAGNTATHACSGGTPRGGTAVLQGNAGKTENHQKY